MGYPHFSTDCVDYHDRVIDWGGPRRVEHKIKPRGVVTLCGSSRFYEEYQEANYRLTMEGYIVLSIGFYPHAPEASGHGEGVGHDSVEKVMLDELHKRKIDMSDMIYVIDVDGYVGDSTRTEIDYAEATFKKIHYMSEGNL